MTRLATVTLSLVLCTASIRAQYKTPLQSAVDRIVYPPLGLAARIQGDVRLRQGPDAVVVLSGSPILAPTAIDSLKSREPATKFGEVEVVFHFTVVQTKTLTSTIQVQRGDAFDRLILRVFGLKTEKVIEKKECVQGSGGANRINVTKAPIEVWVYGRAMCPTVNG